MQTKIHSPKFAAYTADYLTSSSMRQIAPIPQKTNARKWQSSCLIYSNNKGVI